MEINKQLFEDVLAGKLKGTFVLRDRNKYDSSNLRRNTNKRTSYNYPYTLYKGNCVFICYTTNGKNGLCTVEEYKSDIIDFIPDTDMKENYCLYTYECGSLKIFGRRSTRAKHQTITDAIMEYTKHVEHMTKVNKGKPAFVNKQILVVRYTDAYQSEIVGIIENGHYTCIKEGKM